MDSVGVISLVYDVAKDLYTYYVAVKECDTDIKELRTQLLSLQHTSSNVENALKRDGLRTEDKSQVENSVSQFGEATTELRLTLDKIRLDGTHPQKTLEKLKAFGRKAIATSVEQLSDLDTKLAAGTAKLETALGELRISNDIANDEILQQLSTQRKILTDETQTKKAMAIIKTLEYPEIFDRRRAIPEADDASLGWLFTQESRKYPELTNLVTFLKQENGLFWIQGKPASGKSTFVKHLLNRSRGRDKLWSWMGAKEVIFASHFCWIAGTPMQKSQQGLLQALLFQILSSDVALVPIACPSQWTSGASRGSWYEKELWACLHAAIAASGKRICFFIDGVDEIEPENDHPALAKAIARLGMYDNVKIVTSSRPWRIFEQTFTQKNRTMTMQKTNRLSIINYIRKKLESDAKNEAFRHVHWKCVRSIGPCSSVRPGHKHDEAHKLVQTIAGRADGVFLWVALVMDAFCRHLALGCPINVLRCYVDRLPTRLEDYFRTMIFKRIHESVISETAMALHIALLEKCSPSYLALLCQYTDDGVSCLMDANFCSSLPCSTCTQNELDNTIRRTSQFLHESCRDIIDSSWECQWKFFHQAAAYHNIRITFTHRTMFDFLHTPEMQTLLTRHVPKHFFDTSFEDRVRVASLKFSFSDESSHPIASRYWEPLASSIRNCHRRQYLELAKIAEQVALHQFGAAAKHMAITNTASWSVDDNCISLSIELSAYGLFDFTDTVIRFAPQLLTTVNQVMMFLHRQNVLFGKDKRSDLRILRRLLEAGIDSNGEYFYPWSGSKDTIWRIFVWQLRSSMNARTHSKQTSPITTIVQPPRNSANGDRNVPEKDVFSDPVVQDAIMSFIEFGADLTSEDNEMLNRYMPKTMADGRDWSEFLLTYSHPDKRRELREDRKNRIKDWPEGLWSGGDRKLLGLRVY